MNSLRQSHVWIHLTCRHLNLLPANLWFPLPSSSNDSLLGCFWYPAQFSSPWSSCYSEARYFWPNMRCDITAWAYSCVSCQKSKVHKHIYTPLATFSTLDVRFSHIHIDIVEPVSRGFKYLLTCIDHITWWPEAISLYISTESVAQTLILGRISYYRVSSITTDCGGQFESHLFQELSRIFRIKCICMTNNHPALTVW